jgi:hypothetical protein
MLNSSRLPLILGKTTTRVLATLWFLVPIAIDIALIVLSAIPQSFSSCPQEATIIIVYCAVALFGWIADMFIQCCHFEGGRYLIPNMLHMMIYLFNLAWTGYAIYCLATIGNDCKNEWGWAQYNFVMAAILVAVTTLLTFYLLSQWFREVFLASRMKGDSLQNAPHENVQRV